MTNKYLKIFILSFSLLTAMFSFYVWQLFKTPNFEVEEGQRFSLFIPEKASYEQVLDSLNAHKLIKDPLSFRFLAKVLDYPSRVRPGRYLIDARTGNWDLLRKLRNGRQDPYRVTINTWRLKEDIAGKLAKQLPFDSVFIYRHLDSTAFVQSLGFDAATIPALFIPDTYEVNWHPDFMVFLQKMKKYHERFWTDKRKQQAKDLNLSPAQAATLASIVEAESKVASEQARIAGVYWNRLNANMPLQADPTVVFAWKDFSIKRITGKYTGINSPYNTYRNTGLPPGPISIPNPKVLDKVLNLEKHAYIYFCAKEDFSGSHNFAISYADHLKNAAKYQQALDQNHIQ